MPVGRFQGNSTSTCRLWQRAEFPPVKWLIDENIAPSVTALLRDMGEDVLDVKECALDGTSDEYLLDLAGDQSRIVLTMDKGFLDFRSITRRSFFSVLLLRPSDSSRESVCQLVKDVLAKNIEFTPGSVVVANERRIRVSRLPR